MIEKTTTIRVLYKETDQMGVVYYSNYFVWFEAARAELFRDIGHPYKAMEEEMGLRLMVVGAECKYMLPARYDDLISVDCHLIKAGNSSLTFEYIVRKDKITLAEGKTVHVFTDVSGRPKRIPAVLKEVLV